MASRPHSLPTAERLTEDAFKDLFNTLLAPRISDVVKAALEQDLVPREVIDACTRDGLYALCREAMQE